MTVKAAVIRAGVICLTLGLNRPLPAELTQSRNRGGLLVENDRISVLIRDGYHLEPALKKGGTTVTPVVSDRGGRPSFYLTVGELAITDFRIDWERVRTETVNDALGSGKRITLPAQAEQYLLMLYEPIRVGAEVELSFYDSYPSVIVARAKFTNLGKARLQIDEVACLAFRLDRRRLDAEARPWEFASYQGAATRWGRDYALVWITPDFDRRNFMGMGELSSREVAGGGTPLVDLWAPQCGLAVVSAETCQQWISLPVKTAADGTVEVRLAQSPDARLGQSVYLDPGASVSTILSAAILHELDYFDPIHIYADLLRAQGVEIPLASPRPVYEPYWKSWGLRKEFTLQQIYASLEELKRVGLRWANLDDGWFTWYGDWDPNPAPGKFPAGEPDMKKFVAELHGRGFLSSLWWYPQGVSPESHLAAEHPDWLVQNEDGSLPLSRRGLYYLCPVHPPCIEFIRGQVRRILADWDYDGLYIDTQDLSSTPPCFNPAHKHASPLDSYQGQPAFYKAIYQEAQRLKPDCPVEMCICAMPHDPFKMPYYNVANASDPVNLEQVRRRVKVEKAYRGPAFCVGDCYQVPMDEWEGFSVPESFETAMGIGAQVTTFFTDLSADQERTWKRWIGEYNRRGLAWGNYLNLYDIAFDKPEGHVVSKADTLYYGFFSPLWSVGQPIELRGLEKGKRYRVRDYAHSIDLGTISADQPVLHRAFKDYLLLEVQPLKTN